MISIKQFLEKRWLANAESFPLDICLIQSICCAVFLALFSWVFHFTCDSYWYISTAQHIAALQGLSMTHFTLTIPDDIIPNKISPPGFPILIAAMKLVGADEYVAGFLIPYVCFMSLPFLFFFLFRNLMPVAVALAASFVSAFMFAFLRCALIAWSDIPYLCFSLLSLITAFQIIERKGKVSAWFIVGAGMLAGFSFLIRYVGMTLIGSIGIGLAACFTLRIFSGKNSLKVSFFYVLGAALVVLPYLIRNLISFGVIQPLPIGKSDISLLTNFHDYFQGLGRMFFIMSSFEWLALVTVLGFVFYFFTRLRSWSEHRGAWFIYVLILGAYFLLDSILLFVKWTTSYGPEHINERYLIQMAWILAGGLTALIYVLLTKRRQHRPGTMKKIFVLLLFVFLIAQTSSAYRFVREQQHTINIMKMVSVYIPTLKQIPQDYLIVSSIDVTDHIYFFLRRSVRWLGDCRPDDLRRVIGSKRKFAVFLFKAPHTHSAQERSFQDVWSSPPGYRVILSDEYAELLTPQ